MGQRPAIRVEGLSKRYVIGARETRPDSFRELLTRAVTTPFRRVFHSGRETSPPELWALRDICFEVRSGEVVGLIGKNGAGKSTLLKILSRITAPTLGRIEIQGRLGSLLEVGTGFHPELTGRENIYVNGAVLGMRREEIARRFDEIVTFAGVTDLLDTPVKRYSTGMYLRLAFSVAAHLETEVLLVDEVLAVGDADFQKKCLGRMSEVAERGRTVVFVSHSMSAITRLCRRAILLERGRIVADGPAEDVARHYMRSDLGTTAAREWDSESAPGNEVVGLRSVTVQTEDGRVAEAMDIRRPVCVELGYEVRRSGHMLTPNIHLFNEQGVCVLISHDLDPSWRRRVRPIGRYRSTVWIPGNFLAEGTFSVGALVSSHNPDQCHVFERDAVVFQVVDSMDGDTARGDYAGPMPGIVRPMFQWTTSLDDARG